VLNTRLNLANATNLAEVVTEIRDERATVLDAKHRMESCPSSLTFRVCLAAYEPVLRVVPQLTNCLCESRLAGFTLGSRA